VYYNTKKPHKHLNNLPPYTWAYEARQLPDQKFILKDKDVMVSETSNALLKLPEKELLSRIEKVILFLMKLLVFLLYKKMQKK